MLRWLAPLAFVQTLLGCATAQPRPTLRVCSVNLETWRNAHGREDPPRETSELVSRLPKVAERYDITMIFDRASLPYAVPEIDLTPKVLDEPEAPLRAGVHVGVVVMQQALAQSHVGQRARARIWEERLSKQAAVRAEEQASVPATRRILTARQKSSTRPSWRSTRATSRSIRPKSCAMPTTRCSISYRRSWRSWHRRAASSSCTTCRARSRRSCAAAA